MNRAAALLLAAAACLAPALASARGGDQCIARAADHYQVPEIILQAIHDWENGPERGYLTNKNKSIDMGPMGINSVHLPELASSKIGAGHLINDPCLNVLIGAWHLRMSIADAGGDLWKGVGNYHSHSPELNRQYQLIIWHEVQRIYARRARGT